MKTTRSNPVIMPKSQQSEHTSRKRAMNGQMRPDNAMPIFNGTTCPDGLLPGREQGLCHLLPNWLNALYQHVGGGTQDGAAQPGPCQKAYGLWSQLSVCHMLDSLEPVS